MRRHLSTLLVALCAANCAPGALAQPATATLTGVVVATDDARLPGVTLVATPVGEGSGVQAVSTGAGVFRIGNLAPGRYTLGASLDGFGPARMDGIELGPAQTVSVVVRLAVATVHETISVVALTPRDSVERLEIRESRARDVGEAMTAVAGVNKLRKGGIANDVVVRGLQGKDLNVLIDGQRLDGACPGHMDPPAFHVDFAEVQRVEVSKGPFDVKNQGGLAGVVNIVTERPQRGLRGTANVTAGSAATFAPSASLSGGGSLWAALGGMSWRAADPYVDGAGVSMIGRANYRADIAGDLRSYDAWTAWGRVAVTPRDGATLQFSYTHQDAGAIVYPYLQMDADFDRADRAGARLEVAHVPGGWSALAVHGYYTRVDHAMSDELRTSALNMPRPYSMATRAGTEVAGARSEIQRGGFTLGGEFSRRRWDTTSLLAASKYAPQAPLADVRTDSVGAFAAWTTGLGERWRLDSGARLDRASTEADPLTANTALYLAYHGTDATHATDVLPAAFVRAAFHGQGGWTGSLGFGRATRVPDQQERFYALRRMGSDWVGNPALVPSANNGLDGEVRYTRHGFDAGVAAYFYRIDDHILVVDVRRSVMVPGVMNTMARSYANVDALVRGIEASATVPLARTLFLSGDASLTRGTTRDESAAGSDLPEMPPARARVRLRYDNARWNAAMEVAGATAQDHVATWLRETPTPAFAVVNVRAGLRWRKLGITAGLDNVFDTFYAEHLSYQRDPFRNGVRVYEPGRTVSVNLSAGF